MKKTAIIVVAVILIVLAVYYYMNPGGSILESVGLKKPAIDPLLDSVPVVKEDLSTKSATNGGFVVAKTVVQDAKGIPLMEGKSGSYLNPDNLVKNIQGALNARFGANLKIDGIFGPKTAKALSVNGFPEYIYLDDYYDILGA